MVASEMDSRSATTVSCHFQSAPLETVYFMLQMHAIFISLNLIVLTGIKWQQLQMCCRLHTEKVQNGKAALQPSFYKEYIQKTTSRVSVSQMSCKYQHSDSDLLQHVGNLQTFTNLRVTALEPTTMVWRQVASTSAIASRLNAVTQRLRVFLGDRFDCTCKLQQQKMLELWLGLVTKTAQLC